MSYILIVDDDTDFTSAVSTVLKSRGHETAVENDSERSIDSIRQRRPDAVILDVMFPENDTAGFGVARAIRHNFGQLPVLLLTGVNNTFPLGFSNKDRDAHWLPVDEFMEKPVDLNRLCDKIDKLAHR
jgi:two-component system nitrogen regulation response regulator NtrX